MDETLTNCWICGEPAGTHEHRTKRSDLKALFGQPTQRKPIYLHNDATRNRIVGSLDAPRLKWKNPICAECNNARSRPFDIAWQLLLQALIARSPRPTAGTRIRVDRVFKANATAEMLNVHLYFVKQFGCYNAEAGYPIAADSFAKAFLEKRAHPNLYLKFCCSRRDSWNMASGSDLHLERSYIDDRPVVGAWIYQVGPIEVLLMYAADGENRDGMVGAWHPRHGTNSFVLSQL